MPLLRRSVAVALSFALGCTPTETTPSPPLTGDTGSPSATADTGPATETETGTPVVAPHDGVAYGPYRAGQGPGGAQPTEAQIREDLGLIAAHFRRLRTYTARAFAPTMLAVIREDGLPLEVSLGVWLDGTVPTENQAEIDAAIGLAAEYPEIVTAIIVGNETQAPWAPAYDLDTLAAQLAEVGDATGLPVTTAETHTFWLSPESSALDGVVDFLTVHDYALWAGEPLETALAWTTDTYDAVEAQHPGLPVTIGEVGWSTELNPAGFEAAVIVGPVGEAEQAQFFAEFTGWAEANAVPYFFFEAFDEPWKGSADPRDVEKHWGLFHEDRTPKQGLAD